MITNRYNDDVDYDKYDEPRLHMEAFLGLPLVDFDLPLVILLPLESAGIKRIGDLVKQSRKDLLKIPQIGVTKVDQLERFLEHHLLSLKK